MLGSMLKELVLIFALPNTGSGLEVHLDKVRVCLAPVPTSFDLVPD